MPSNDIVMNNTVDIDTDTDMHSDTFAWLVPTAPSSPAQRALGLASNAPLVVPSSSLPAHLAAHLPHTLLLPGSASDGDDRSQCPPPCGAVRLAFSHPTKHPGCFTIGTDPSACDLVLLAPRPLFSTVATPSSRLGASAGGAGVNQSSQEPRDSAECDQGFVSPQHCAITFDDRARLVLHDFSARGTAVWSGCASDGDMTDHTWILNDNDNNNNGDATLAAGASPIVIDIQGARFRLVLNDRLSADAETYRARVDAFCAPTVKARPDSLHDDGDPVSASASVMMPWIAAAAATAGGQHHQHHPAVDWLRKGGLLLPSETPPARVFKPVVVTAHGRDPACAVVQGVYLWNVARPWEPMVRASA
ncbi:glycerol kinase [Purpureocillium lavendulum]|uniref:Glycerol kinase n=1 Tax=Purpureocillium lavendulum TaxID=1247861 RepID=A0AB34FDY4_9HYPO|nr:glycerol kinase [Purpureocillium lavendulum]